MNIIATLINMSISASWLVLAIVLLRSLIKKASRQLCCALWGFVGIRLIMPFSIESPLSLIPSAAALPDEMLYSQPPTLSSAVNPIIASVNPLQAWTTIAFYAWLVGAAAMLIYALISYIRLKSKVRTAVLLRENIYQCDDIASPFVLGLIRPRIYLPFNLPELELKHVIAHEKAHIVRGDSIIKPLGFLLLAVNWFNPLIWLAYILLCRDIEFACDERATKALDDNARKEYSSVLVNLSFSGAKVAACPLAFGETGVKQRIKSVLNYKKPALWIIIASILCCAAIAICFLTNPINPLSDASLKNDAYSLAYSCAMVNGKAIEKSNCTITRGTDNIYVDFATSDGDNIRVDFEVKANALNSARVDLITGDGKSPMLPETDGAIVIIGGADGPTSIFVAGKGDVTAAADASTGDKNVIADIQTKLFSLGYLTEEYIRGSYDEATMAAIMRFQSSAEIAPDGILGEATLKALFEAE